MKPGLQPHTLLDDEQRAYWDELHRRVLSGEKFKTQFPYEDRFFEVSFNPVFDGDRVVGFSEYTCDITVRKQAEEALAAAKQRSESDYRLLFEEMLDVVVVHDIIRGPDVAVKDYQLVQANPAFASVLGLSADQVREMIGRTVSEILPLMPAATRQALARVVETGETARFETPLPDFGLYVDAHAMRPLPDRLVVIFQDITHRRQLEEERRRADRLQSVGLLAGGIAHDFNNILASLLGNVELARLDIGADSTPGRMLTGAVKACDRASALTKQLLTFARGGEPVTAPCALGPLLEEWSGFALRGSNVRHVLEVADDLWPTEIDVGQISQVIHNLLINADQAMPGGGTVRLTADNAQVAHSGERSGLRANPSTVDLMPGCYVRLRVSDEGEGIAADLLPRIFDPYFTTKEHGVGLGLATCYAVVRNHHGGITAASKLGEGCTFEVLLPAVEGAAVAEPTQTDELPTGSGRVLFMDDDAGIREVAESMLEYLGYDVDLVSNGKEAIDAFRGAVKANAPYRAVILDLTVPGGLGGAEVISELRALDPDVRAIVSSGYCSDPVMAHHRDYGFSGVVAKPYQLESLAKALREVAVEGPAD